MHRIQHGHALSVVMCSGFLSRLALFICLAAFASRLHAQTSFLITNVAQLSRTVDRQRQVVADIRLKATVFACDTNTGALILQDASGAELLELDGLKTEFNGGDQIEIDSEQLLFSSSDVGIYVSTAPLLNNDGVHVSRTVNVECSLAAGRHAVRLDWFNQVLRGDLAIWCEPPGSDASGRQAIAMETNLIHGASAECYQGYWYRLPNFQLLQPVKVGNVTDFDIGFGTRDEKVGIRFEGYVDARIAGKYVFHLRSDDGSRLWIGNTGVPVRKIGTGTAPLAPQAAISGPKTGKDERRLATIDGRVSFATRSGKGIRLELLSEQGPVIVNMADSGELEPAELMNASVRVSGVAGNVLTTAQRAVPGSLSVASSSELTIVEKPPGSSELPSVLKTVARIHNLSSNEAARGLPVDIQGTVTAVAPAIDHWMVIQDDTRGTFVELDSLADCRPNVGELWRIGGRTKPGGFAPVIAAEKAALLGNGRLPQPARPTWSQLANGSMDVQWVELEGVVTDVSSNGLSLLLPEGRQTVGMPEWGESELGAVDKALVRIRGTLFAVWDQQAHEARPGNITMHNASVAVEKPAPTDPFDAPEKTPRGLFHFDAKAMSLQPVKVLGQVTYVDSQRIFLEEDAGIEVYPRSKVELKAGDMVGAVGYPGLYSTGPRLREALLRKIRNGVLPAAPLVSGAAVPIEKFAAKRIRIEGDLAGSRAEGATLTLQIQTRSQLYVASVANDASLERLRPGSKLSLTGVYASSASGGMPSSDGSHFELLVNAPGDVVVLSAPSWWTLERLLSAVGVLLMTLVLAAVWIAILRRQVTQRTLRLQQEIREREHAERQHAFEAERSRIARDLHDELGSGLTEMSLLASAGLEEQQDAQQTGERLHKIAEKARALVAGLDVIVWAIDPRRNSLQSFADYVEWYAEELLSASKITCRFKIPVECKAATLTGSTRHSLLLAIKEALTNVIRHSSAKEVELQITQPDDHLQIIIADNGCGFDVRAVRPGNGLRNLQERLNGLQGRCHIESLAGKGTTIEFILPLTESACRPNTR